MIKTKEEVNLTYLAGPFELEHNMDWGEVERNDETRQAVLDLGNPRTAYVYSDMVDQKPHPELRKMACKDPWFAYLYARNVDGKPLKETKEAVSKDEEIKRYYVSWEKEFQ